MLNLLEGIKIVDYCSIHSHQPRAWISPGTCKATQSNFFELPYSEDAFVPIESWRELNRAEQRLLLGANSNSVLNKSVHIGIIHLPEPVVAPLLDLGIAFAQTAEDCQLLSQHPSYRVAINQLIQHLSPLCSADEPLVIHPVSINSVGLPTVTFNQATQQLIGLHLDSWDKLLVEQRHLSTNRICINLGLEDRFLLFVNLSLIDMMRLTQMDSLSSQRSPIAIRHDFLTKYPDYPVIKLRILPGEAYIAPTENMIHDGCTIGKQFFDITLTIRGHINLPSHFLVGEKFHEQQIQEFSCT